MQTIARSVYFIAPGQVQVREQPLPTPEPRQVVVQTLHSAISSGTELLFYRGQFPTSLPLDAGIAALQGSFQYPLRYGYSATGRVSAVGTEIDPAWVGRLVFAFQPHTSHFLAGLDELFPLPPGIEPDQAVFLPNMETAVNFAMDGAPLIGEQVAVFGQGIVGLMTTALLSRFPLGSLVTLDRYPLRRQAALELGAVACLDPAAPGLEQQLIELLPGGADLVYELSGAPQALNQAIAACGFGGRVVIGSWYGTKRAELELGGHFHRNRIRLVSSQVSSLAPELSGRWSKARRFALAWEMLRRVQPQRWITRRFALDQAATAYALLDQHPEGALQIVFDY